MFRKMTIKTNAYVEFNLSDYDKKDSELIYYSSVEEAILNSPLNAENEEFSVPEDFLNHVDEIIAYMEWQTV